MVHLAARDRVELLHWPEQASRRVELADLGILRLLLVKQGTPPPEVADLGEDWVRTPADEHELFLRIQRLAQQRRPISGDAPLLDEDDVLQFGGAWVALSRSDAAILQPLLTRYGRLVSSAALAQAAWPDGRTGRRALGSRIHRLRGRLRPLGLSVYSIRSRGFLLAASENTQET